MHRHAIFKPLSPCLQGECCIGLHLSESLFPRLVSASPRVTLRHLDRRLEWSSVCLQCDGCQHSSIFIANVLFFDYVVPLESGVWTVGHLLKKLRIAIVTSGNLWH